MAEEDSSDSIIVNVTGDDNKSALFGKYDLGKLLGSGAFAKVYQAEDLHNNGESVAIKVVQKKRLKDGLTAHVKREISVMRRLRHPHIVLLSEVLATKTKIYFVMELAKGGELFSRVSSNRFTESLSRKYFRQLISAVRYCHARGVYHRDLKPENLLLDENRDLKVSDFGLSAMKEQIKADGMLHTLCGTPAYVAPELLTKKGYDGSKADIWSCGVVLYVLIAGCLPFQDENLMNMYRKIFRADFEYPPWFSPESRRLVSKLLVVDPDRRISMPAIMRTPWLRKNFTPPLAFNIDEPISEEEACDWEETEPVSPKFFNAFEFISSMSSGFDLSSLFQSKRKLQSVFTSRSSATEVMEKIETVTKEMNMSVKSTRKDFKVKMEGKTEGRKGRLSMTAEVFEVAPEISVVEFYKSAGDTLEYNKLYEEQVRPALNDIVWSWHGDNTAVNNATIH